MLLQPYVYPEYKFSDKCDYNKPIPPQVLYDEQQNTNSSSSQEINMPKKQINHLALLAQTCTKYSQEFDIILSNIPALASPSNQSSASSTLAYPNSESPFKAHNLNEDFEQNRNEPIKTNKYKGVKSQKKSLKLKKRLKKLKKLSKKLASKEVESSLDGEPIFIPSSVANSNFDKVDAGLINNSLVKSSEINCVTSSKGVDLLTVNNHLKVNSTKHEMKNQRFNPYEKKLSPNNLQNNKSTFEAQRPDPHGANIKFTCNWLINGSVCGLSFMKNDEFNDHIKLHTTNELFTDLKFYYQAKNLLSSREVCLR